MLNAKREDIQKVLSCPSPRKGDQKMTCEQWLEMFIKRNQPVTPGEVYEAGKKAGFTRAEIKKARRWFGKDIDTEIRGDTTLWRWAP